MLKNKTSITAPKVENHILPKTLWLLKKIKCLCLLQILAYKLGPELTV